MIKKINRLKKMRGITNRYIARKYGVSETWVSLVIHEKGKSRRIKRAIARALRQPMEDLWPEQNNKRKAA